MIENFDNNGKFIERGQKKSGRSGEGGKFLTKEQRK